MSACQTETPAPQIVLVTGASSGFGRLVANAIGAGKRGCAPVARSGHTVYAAMHETTGRNAPTYILANEMRGKNITVNAIAPGPTATISSSTASRRP